MTAPLLIFTGIALAFGLPLRGQHSAAIAASAVVKPLAEAPNTDNITGTQTMIVNRFRVLKDKVDGERTRYFAVTGSYAAKAATDAARLTPAPVTPRQNVRVMDIVVDIEHPLFVRTGGKTPFTIGTAILDGKVRDLQVNSKITLGELKITKK